ncbi:hypothetical protein GGR42_001989 [Saonia flava]|uniref:ATP synthase protein I n=1 Tax=Saonia flava TaxID=523696 RepID=A0A846QWC0_9FLAO|nr:DUF6168 family protein [Saonia flava]NJB71527.1 hypothetical protein [Saonia flava]
MPKSNTIPRFLVYLLISLGLAFVVHITILKSAGFPKYDNFIVKSYIVNGTLAGLIYIIIFVFKQKLKNQIGFLFMGGSFLKFIFFFLLFYPLYKEDGNINRLEFAAFFVPYAISLIIETIFMAKMLNNLK